MSTTCGDICCLYEHKANKFQNCPRIVVPAVIFGYSGTLTTNIIFPTTCGKYLLYIWKYSKQISKLSQNVVPTIIIGQLGTLTTNIILPTTCGDICCLYKHKAKKFQNCPIIVVPEVIISHSIRWLQISYCQQHVEIFVVYMNIKQTNFKIVPESWFQRLFLVIRVRWLQIIIFPTTCGKYLLYLWKYSKQISKLSQNRGSNDYYWSIGYTDYKYHIANNMWRYLLFIWT